MNKYFLSCLTLLVQKHEQVLPMFKHKQLNASIDVPFSALVDGWGHIHVAAARAAQGRLPDAAAWWSAGVVGCGMAWRDFNDPKTW